MTIFLEILAAALNSLWEAALVAALVWLGLRFIRTNAATRYIVWWAALAVVLVLPAVPRVSTLLRARSQPAAALSPQPATLRGSASLSSSDSQAFITLREERAAKWPFAILGLWAAVFLYHLAQIVRSYFYLRGVKRRSKASSLTLPSTDRAAQLLTSSEVSSPMAVGFLPPAVILPESLPAEITQQELDHVLLHEYAHLSRRDDWANLLARLLGAVLALHPAAWWILRQIEREREMACDDWVVARVGSARPYAASLVRLFELRWSQKRALEGEALASGIFGGGSRLGERIEKLLKRGRDFSAAASFTRVAASGATLLALALAGSLAPRWIAFAQEPRLAFDVASVKRNMDDRRAQSRLRYNPLGIDLTHAPISWIIGEAYQVPYSWVSSSDARIRDMLFSERGTEYFYDISARTEQPTSKERIRLMLQSLLAERFKLTLHLEPRTESVYKLDVGKNGPRLQAAEGEGEPVITPGLDAFVFRNVDMARFARILSMYLGRPVLDVTGLKGNYNSTIKTNIPGSAIEASGKAALFDWFSGAFFNDLEKQVGLKLEADKASVDYLVVDHVEQPEEN
jgi:uncharacterized protein (TIGR03435 family)